MKDKENGDDFSCLAVRCMRPADGLASVSDVREMRDLISSLNDAERSRLIAELNAEVHRLGYNISIRTVSQELAFQSVVKTEAILGALSSERRAVRLDRAPGFAFCRLIGHICPKRYRERVLEAFHAEVIADYTDALAKGDLARARMINICMYPQMTWQVFGALISQLASAVYGKFGKTSGDN